MPSGLPRKRHGIGRRIAVTMSMLFWHRCPAPPDGGNIPNSDSDGRLKRRGIVVTEQTETVRSPALAVTTTSLPFKS